MVLFLLYIKAELDGIGSLALRKDANISVSVRNPLSDYEVREKVVFNLQEEIEAAKDSREPPCQFALKWEGNQKRSYLQVLGPNETKTALKKKKAKGVQVKDYTADDNGQWTPILAVECRGLEPYAFHSLGDEFVVESEGGVTFEDVDLSEGDWGEYDEENDAAVAISEFETKFEPL